MLVDPLAIQHDQALYVDCGWRIVHGQIPYRDFFDINPPFIMYLNALPAAAARVLGVNPIPVFTIAVALLSGWSAAAALRVARPVTRGVFAAELPLLLVPLGAAATLPASIDAGQREHLFVLLYFPYLLMRVLRTQAWGPQASSTGSFLLGVAAGAGACIKPFFAVPIAAIEGYALWRGGAPVLRAPEVAGAAASAAIYGVGFLLLPHDARDAFVHRVVPLVRYGYAAYDNIPWPTIVRHEIRWAAVAVVLALVARREGSAVSRVFVWPIALFTLGSLGGALLQAKGWSYHYIPARAGLWMLGGLALLACARAVAGLSSRLSTWATTAACALLTLVLLVWPIRHQQLASTAYTFAPTLERYTERGDGVVVVSSEVLDAFPALLQTGRAGASRHLWSGMLTLALYARQHGYAPGAVEEQRFMTEVAEDIERGRPKAVFVDDRLSCLGCPAGVRLSAPLLADARIRGALVAYADRGLDHGFRVFTRTAAGTR